jgi:hypothetical protein
MILPDLCLVERAHEHSLYSGLDSAEHCLDRWHFDRYAKQISYHMNSRGFRDREWPESVQALQHAIWCVGDSYTLGLGVPEEHTWPRLLEQHTGSRCINISMDGASNDWICRRAQDIVRVISPRWMVVQWSFIERWEHPDVSLTDLERRRAHRTDDRANIQNLAGNIELLEQARGSTEVIHSTIPLFSEHAEVRDLMLRSHCPANRWIPHFGAQDLGRDGLHYDEHTARKLVLEIVDRM